MVIKSQGFINKLQQFFVKEWSSIIENLNSLSEHNLPIKFIRGIRLLDKCEVFSIEAFCSIEDQKQIQSLLFQNICHYGIAVKFQPIILSFVEDLMDLSFKVNCEIEKLIEQITDPREITEPDTNSKLHYGQYFFQVFKKPLTKHILKTFPDKFIYEIFVQSTTKTYKILYIIVNLLKEAKSNQLNAQSLIEKLINNEKYWLQLKDQLSWDEIFELVQLSSLLVDNFRNEKFAFFQNWVCEQITNNKLNVYQKCQLLGLLPQLVSKQTCIIEPFDNVIRKCLMNFRDNVFPMTSTTKLQKEDNIKLVFNKILIAMELCSSCLLFEIIVEWCIKDPKHPCVNCVKKYLQLFFKRLNKENQVYCCTFIYNKFISEYLSEDRRHMVADIFLIPLITYCKKDAALHMYCIMMEFILKTNNENLLANCSGKARNLLISKITCFKLVEEMFRFFSTTEINCPTIIPYSLTQTQSKSLLIHFRNSAVKLRNIAVQYTSESREIHLLRLLHCNAYNMLVTIISNTAGNDVHVFSMFLFYEHLPKTCIWKHLLDNDKHYEIPIDFEMLPQRRKILINIQRKMNKNNSSENYINFQTYFRSSLADEFDFNNVSLRSSLSLDDDLYHSNSQLFSQPVSVELELDDFNNHECMAHLCAVIAHMASVTDHGTESCTDMPEWMNYLKLSFCQDSSKDKNFKMFLMKLIVNCESYFEPYAKQWLSPIMKFILEKQLGNSMNYFLADVVTMLVSWKTSAIPSTNEEKNLAKKLLCFLLSVSKTEVKNVFKHNIELIKLLVENWKQSLEMEYDVLLHLIKPDTTNNIWSECGLHLVGIITANGILPFSIHNNKIFFNILLDNLKNNYPGIYVTSSELLGMILKIVDETLIIETDLVNNVTSTIKLKENSNITKMLSCLYSIQKHYSKILISYMNDLFKIFKNLHGHHRTQCLEMFSNGLDLIDRPFEQLSHLHGFFDIIKDSDSEDQLICLNIILNLVKSLKAEDLILLINSIVEIPNQNNRNHRKQVYEIMKTAHKIHIGHMNNESKQITEVCKKCLLTGLMDNDKELRKEVFRYWADDEKLPLKCIDRLLKLMNQLYLPNTESNFLGNLVSILLESCCTASDYEQNIFQHPLHVCKFENYKFIASWRAQHLSSVPIYADTIASQINQSNTHEYSTSVHCTMFQIKRTMTFQFEPTEYEFSSNMSVQDLCSSSTLNSTDSSTNNIVLEANDQKKGTSDFIQKQQRRILHSKQLQSKIHAMKNIQINENRDIFKKERAQKREANVNMFREYRIGDFPDIEITNSSIIKPLIELAKRDNGISRTVLSSIMSGLKYHIINKHSFFESLNNSLAKMVNDCHYNTSFVGFILDTAFCYPSEIHINICRVTEAAISSGLLSMGALVIESSINSLESENLDVQPGKKTKPNENLDDAWIKLAELYKNIGELDVVEGIFQDKINKISCELLQEALKAEQSKDWRLAQSKFHSVIESYSQNSILTNDTFFLFEEYYKCSEYLSDWKEINRVLKLQAGNNYERIWDSNWNKIHLLPRILNSELHNIYARQSDGKFIDIFNEWLSNFEKEEYILTNTAPQASMIYLCCNEFKKAQLYCKHRMRNFLHEWANIDPQYDKLRAERLLDLQTVSEIYCYTLSLLTKPIDNLKSICDQIKMWQSKLPVKSDSIILWDTKILYRSFFLSKIKESNNNLSIEEKTSLTQLIREYEMQSTLAFVECAINQNNFYVAKKYMNKLQNKNNINNWMSDVTLCHSKVLSMYTWYTTKPEKKLKYYIDSLSELDKINKQQCSPICLIKMHTHIADISTNIHTIFYESTNTEQIDHSLKIQVNQKLNIKSEMSDPHGIIHQIDSNVIENLKYAINIALCNKVSNNIIIDAYLKLAQHCLKEFDTQGNDKNIHKLSLFVESILKSMKYGGKKAWILFPLVLQQNLTNNTLKEIFIKESQDLPEYMLLEWIDQILGCLDSPLISVFGTLLISIAKIYPKALQYPLRVYMEKDVYKFHETQEFLKTKLYPLVCDNNLDLFINGINNICCPFSQLLEHINCIQKSFRMTCSIAIVFEFKRMFNQCFLTDENKNIKGLEFKKLDCYKNGLQSILDRHLSSSIDQKTAVKELDLIKHNVMEEKKRNYKMLSNKFIHYCPWLMKYSMYCIDSIEVPGQYSGLRIPNPSKHITISSFESKVLVVYSLRRPIKITIIGSDGIEYSFLVKSNEDLRQDQRIEQLLLLMNSILSEEAYCKRQLSVMTYTVVPITSRLGMIEWIDDTVTIKDLISYSITKNDTSGTTHLLENLFNEHYCWLSKKTNSTHSPTIYAQATIEYNHITTVAMFKKLSQSIPTDILRLSLLSMCHSAEMFICFRSKFITSYSVLSICHWLLGIGDRHLMNTIVSIKTGHCIGIDFNFAFHTATSLQVIPELIPFRMTPHLISLMAPLNVTGFIRETMVNSLTILINNKVILLSVMQVFINEPSIDWIKIAKEEILKIDSDIDLKNIQEWFPKKKILAAKDKMDGINPIEILKRELESSTVISESYKNALEIMLTKNSINNNFKRSLLSKKNITINQQIDCLLDLATDEHILGKAYGGLELWI